MTEEMQRQIKPFSKSRLIMRQLLLLFVMTGVLGRLTDVPRNKFVLEGTTVVFTCCSDVKTLIFWEVKPTGSQFTQDIYGVSGLINGFRTSSRFSVTNGSSPECYRLTIRDVKRENAGTYTCIDNEGLGQKLNQELVVIESFGCEEPNGEPQYMGENNFNLPQDVISTVCISKYSGNVSPKPICEWSSGTKLLHNYHRVTETHSTMTLNIQMPAMKAFNGDRLSCYVKIDVESIENQTTTVLTNWTSSSLIVNYASFHQKGIQQCNVVELSLDCQPPCTNKMARFSNGSIYCEIAYPSQTHKKVFVLLQDTAELHKTTFISGTTSMTVEGKDQSSGVYLISTSVLSAVLICCLLASTTTFIIIRKRKKRQRRDIASEMTMLVPNKGHQTISKPGIIINMGDGNNVTVNTVYGDQQSSVTMKHGRKPILAELNTDTLKRQSSSPTPNSEPENVAIRGVAILGKELFLAYRNSSHMKVYCADTLGYKLSWELTDLIGLEDMTACNEHNCLYVSNNNVVRNAGEIFRVSPQGDLIKKWETGRNYFGRLSVTHDFNVLMAAYYNRKLVEYEPNGNQLREIQLPDVLNPIYALKINSNYYVSHGHDEDPIHGVSQLDPNGKLLNKFGAGKGSANDQLDTPVHLAMNDGYIWVADSQNGRVVVLSPTLEYQSTILSKEDQLKRPLRICLDLANRRLLLSDFHDTNHWLRVFSLM